MKSKANYVYHWIRVKQYDIKDAYYNKNKIFDFASNASQEDIISQLKAFTCFYFKVDAGILLSSNTNIVSVKAQQFIAGLLDSLGASVAYSAKKLNKSRSDITTRRSSHKKSLSRSAEYRKEFRDYINSIPILNVKR